MGKFLALSEFHSGGLAKGTSFDRDNDRIISRIGLHDPQAIREAAAKLGGTELQEKSDLSFLFSFLPHIPIKFNSLLPEKSFSMLPQKTICKLKPPERQRQFVFHFWKES